MTAAGVLFFCDGMILLMKRAPGVDRDHPGVWSFPAGHIETDETPEVAARREVLEETGHVISAPMKVFDATESFTTYVVNGEKFPPVMCDEHSECGWFDVRSPLPDPLHPGVQAIVDRIRTFGLTELDVARMIVVGELTSPQRVENMWLFNIRITGTGTAYRRALDELVYRPPEHYLNDDFLARCNGLPVIFQHPEKKVLNSAEFSDRIVGTIMLPYIKVDEVWGISRIYDDDAAAILNNEQFSTSPAVVFRDETVNNETIVENGGTLLIEGKPSLLDHLALCEAGVWDKGGEPSGVISNELVTREDTQIMATDPTVKADDDTGNLDKVLAAVDSLGKKVDSVATRMDSYDEKVAVADKKRADAEEAEKEAKAKADAEAEEEAKAKADAEEAEKEAKAKADAEAEEEAKKADADCEAAMADAQSKADSLCGVFGKSAPVPRKGESPKAYRRRVAAQYAGHSPAYKGVKIEGIADDALFEIAEKQIYADALEAAHNPGDVAEGTLREVVRADVTGRRVSTFHGTPNAWMGQFKLPGRRLIGINKEH